MILSCFLLSLLRTVFISSSYNYIAITTDKIKYAVSSCVFRPSSNKKKEDNCFISRHTVAAQYRPCGVILLRLLTLASGGTVSTNKYKHFGYFFYCIAITTNGPIYLIIFWSSFVLLLPFNPFRSIQETAVVMVFVVVRWNLLHNSS